MPELPQRKVGIIACSGEELPEGLVTRLAALKVLEDLRSDRTVTICLSLFLAGGESDRAFARFYPTIAVDGCAKRCAYRGTERYSNRPAVGLVIPELVEANGLLRPGGLRRLDAAGQQVLEAAAQAIAAEVDRLLDRSWSRREGSFTAECDPEANEGKVEACSCGSGVPVQHVLVDGRDEAIVALPLILAQFRQQGKAADEATAAALLETVKIYNPVPADAEAAFHAALLRAYRVYLEQQP